MLITWPSSNFWFFDGIEDKSCLGRNCWIRKSYLNKWINLPILRQHFIRGNSNKPRKLETLIVLVFFPDAFMYTRFYFLNACMMNVILNFNFKYVLLPEFKMSNPIIALLSKDVLIRDNFQKWKSNLNIVLVGENIRYILNVPKPPVPNNTATCHVKDEYDQCVASNNKTIAYMLASIFDVLRAKFEN